MRALALLAALLLALGRADYRQDLRALEAVGDYRGVLQRATEELEAAGGRPPDAARPSLLQYMGVAAYRIGRLDVAAMAFESAVDWDPGDVASWHGLGDSLLNTHQPRRAAAAYEEAVLRRRLTDNVSKLYHARVNMALWRDYDELTVMLRRRIARGAGDVGAADFSDVGPRTLLALASSQVYARASPIAVPRPHAGLRRGERLRVGFVSSDYGVHPVSSLVRGVLQALDARRFEVFCYTLTDADSYWRQNISATVEHFVSLTGLGSLDAARAIASDGVHVLLELNGQTLNSGLPVLAHRPSPVQLTWLGSPMSSGAQGFVDYFLGDAGVSPPGMAAAFSERLALAPRPYMPTDHAQLQGHTVTWGRARSCAAAGVQGLEGATRVFAVFSNFQKMDPRAFDAWMQLLQRVPGSRLLLLRHMGADDARPNLLARAAAAGVLPSRLVFAPMVPWVRHTWTKSCVDLALDTRRKNGHTTVADALWAGVPTVTVSGELVANRIGAALLQALGAPELATASMREYTDVASRLGGDAALLAAVRRRVEALRLRAGGVFDTPAWTRDFERLLRSLWSGSSSGLHVVGGSVPPKDGDGEVRVFVPPEAEAWAGVFEHRVPTAPSDVLLLHLGGQQAREGWTIVDATTTGERVEALPQFASNSAAAVYASHVLEHVAYGLGGEALQALREWRRVLKPGGLLLVAVPDLPVLSRLFLNETLSLEQRYFVMRMIYGGQVDEDDFHKAGYDEALLRALLETAGFCDVSRVASFGLFNDTSTKHYLGVPISLNMRAVACKEEVPRSMWISVGVLGTAGSGTPGGGGLGGEVGA